MDDATEILDRFAKNGWDSRPFERMIEMAAADAGQAARLVALAIERGGKGATFLDAAVSHVPEPLLPELARQAIEAFGRDRRNEVAEGVIANLSLQSVDSLQPYLSRLFFELRPNMKTYYACWPWRGAAPSDVDELLAYIPIAGSFDERLRALTCVLQSRSLQHVAAALEHVGKELPYPQEAYLNEVGLDAGDRWLYTKSAFHIQLPLAYVDDPSRPPWLRRANHPSWSFPAGSQCRFGGAIDGACGACRGPLHHLITLDAPAPGLGITSRAAVRLVTCLSCLGWSEESLFFRHGEQGELDALWATPATPEFPAVALPETVATLAPTPRRWLWQDWALSNGRENLHRVGGHPSWIQSAQYPSCPECQRLMPFLMQLDSNLPTADGEDWLWGSGGICYVFWCDSCAISAALWQCT